MGEKKSNLMVFSELLNRLSLSYKLGMQYGSSRDIYEALGYPKTLIYEDYYAQFSRQDIAKAVITRPVKATWKGNFQIIETDDDEETEFEKQWKALYKSLRLKSAFKRLDTLSCLGEYGVLFLGFDDAETNADLAKEAERAEKLLYVKPLGQGSAEILEKENDATNPRYGLPKFYQLEIGGEKERSLVVHHSRVIHVAGELLESECYGIPALQDVFNRLKDLEKIVGGSAEMFWRGGRPGYHGKVAPDAQLTEETEEALKEQLAEYEHNLRRFLVTEGIDIEALTAQIADPRPAVEVQLQMISAATGIPKRILVGSERGELASTQDDLAWREMIQERRGEVAESQIIRPFVDKLIQVGVLPEVENYTIQWDSLFSVSEKDQAEVGKIKSETLKNYVSTPTAEDIVPTQSFYRIFLGLNDEEIELIEEEKEAQMEEEKDLWSSVETIKEEEGGE